MQSLLLPTFSISHCFRLVHFVLFSINLYFILFNSHNVCGLLLLLGDIATAYAPPPKVATLSINTPAWSGHVHVAVLCCRSLFHTNSLAQSAR